MLVLTRRKNQRIVIEVPGHEPIFIQVAETYPSKVHIGIEASNDVTINREEIYRKILKEKNQ